MKLECLKEKIENAISKADKVTSKNVTLPVLKYILLVAKNNTLTIRATNLDLGVEIKIPVKVEEEGTVAVPAELLKSFIGNITQDSKITLETKDNTLLVTTNNSQTKVKTYPHEEFPSIPRVVSDKTLKLPIDKFIHGLKSVWYSASPQSMKPELASVYIYNESGSVVFAATDSFRLAEKSVSFKSLDDFESILIPFKNVSDVIKVFDDIKGEVEISITQNQIGFSIGDLYVTSRVVDGVFPDYRQIIPKEYETECVVLKQDVIDVMKQANIFSDKFNRITFEVKPKEKKFIIKTSNKELGESSINVSAALSGDPQTVSFSYRNVFDCFQSITTDSLVFKIGPGKPIYVQGVGDSSFIYIAMPMNK